MNCATGQAKAPAISTPPQPQDGNFGWTGQSDVIGIFHFRRRGAEVTRDPASGQSSNSFGACASDLLNNSTNKAIGLVWATARIKVMANVTT